MKRPFLFSLLGLSSILIWINGSISPFPEYEPKKVATALQAVVDSAINDKIPGVLLHVESPQQKISWSGAAGVSDLKTQTKLQPDQSFRIASVTKTFVACSILRLWEMGKLSLNDPISKYIAVEHVAILKEGGYDPEQINIRHLLTHSSGMFDHAATQIYFEKILADPSHQWTRTEQLRACITWGKPLGKPGEKFSYSDTGYTLLGETLEKITGKRMGEAFESLLNLKKLGLTSTWVEDDSNQSRNNLKRIHQYFNGTDTYDFHASIDLYGGGGLLSTSKDLALYFQQLFNHKVFAKPATLDTMLAKRTYAVKPRMDYRIGMYVVQINGEEVYTHSGFWGTQVIYVPSKNASIATNYSQIWTTRGQAPVLAKALTILQNQK